LVLLLVCVLGVAAAPLLVWLMGSGLQGEAFIPGSRGDDALDVSLHRLHVAGRLVGRHPEHLDALCGAGHHAGAAQFVRDRLRFRIGRAPEGPGRAAVSTRWRWG
jgi:hypothetical protein